MRSGALAFEDFLVHLCSMNRHPGRRANAEFHLVTVQLKDVHGDVIADGNDFAYTAA
jgi:hypothetical protein